MITPLPPKRFGPAARRGLVLAILATLPLTAFASDGPRSGPLLDAVRMATARYKDISIALGEGWTAATPCVSGPDEGAMGVHLVLPSRLGDGAVDPSQPEALMYEPERDGSMRLVAVEYIVLESSWAAKHPDGSVPAVAGHLMSLVTAPNRYGLPSFYELHVWAWRGNPMGTFADWNPHATCDYQPLR